MRAIPFSEIARYVNCIEISKGTRRDIDRDAIRGHEFDLRHTFLPDGLSCVDELAFLSAGEQRFLSQVQDRTCANIFGMVEHFIGAKMLDVTRDHWLGEQTALGALARFTGEEVKHLELFRRIERLAGDQMPPGYGVGVAPNDVASFVLGKCTWAVLAFTCDIELFTPAHYRTRIGAAGDLSGLFKDVFLFHWKRESRHAIVDEPEWPREDGKPASSTERDAAIDDLIALVGAVDSVLQAQAKADAAYFMHVVGKAADEARAMQVQATVLKAYRWQYIASGVIEPRFKKLLSGMINEAQLLRIQSALAPLTCAVPIQADAALAMAD